MTTATQEKPATTATTFHVSSSVLLSMLGYLAPAIGSKLAIASLSGVLIDAADGTLRLRTCNLDQNIIVQCKALVATPGQVVIPFKELAGFAGALAGDTMLTVTTTPQATRATITAERAKAVIECYQAEDFPGEPAVHAKLIELPAGQLLRAVEMVAPAVANDNSRPSLHCLLIHAAGDGVKVVGADGFRLHITRLALGEPVEAERKLLVPKETLRSIAKLLDPKGEAVALHLAGQNQVALRQGERVLISRTAEETFPDYTRLIPEQIAYRIVAPAGTWQQAIRVASALGDGDNGGCLHITVPACAETVPADVGLRVSAEAIMTATVNAGEAEVLKVNYAYLSDAIASAADGEGVSVGFNSVSSPIRVEAVNPKPGPEFIGVVMPMHERGRRGDDRDGLQRGTRQKVGGRATATAARVA